MPELVRPRVLGPLAIFGALVSLAGLAGCSTTTDKLKARYAKEHACDADEVQVVSSGGTTYRASGCGASTEYVCSSFASMGDDARGCEEPGLQKKPGGEPPNLPGPTTAPDPPGTLPK